ncbi:uncharacterized protein LOC143276653 isoform X2 [Babylonia areolata]
MESEDDICVLPHSDDDIDVDAGINPPIHFSPFSAAPFTSRSSDLESASHFALTKAYLNLKQKLSETTAENRQLSRRVQELESVESRNLQWLDSYQSFVNIGESFDMMEDARYAAEGRPGMQATGDTNTPMGGNEGLANNLRRQMAPVTSPSEGVENRYGQYKEKNQAFGSLNQQVALLKQENSRLQQQWEAERKEKEAALQSLRSLQEQCHSLQQERDKAGQEGVMVNEKRGDSLMVEAPAELVSEIQYMRNVIDKLKSMVKLQKDCLVQQSMSLSVRHSLNRPCPPRGDAAPSMESPSSMPGGSGGGSHSGGQSWEMVNGAVPPSHSVFPPHDQRQQHQKLLQQQQQQQPLKGPSPDRSPRREPTMMMNIPPTTTTTTSGAKPVAVVSTGNPNGPAPNPNGPAGAPKPRLEGIHRRYSEDVIQPPKGTAANTEVRAHTLPQQQTPRLADWMGSHYHHQQQQQQQQQQQLGVRGMPTGLNQFLKDAPNTTAASTATMPAQGMMIETAGGAAAVVPLSRRVQPTEVHYPPTPSPIQYPPQRQPSPHSQPPSIYENLSHPPPPPSSTGASSQSTSTVPSMHILNQSSMTGGRVLQNTPASGSGGCGGMITNAPSTATHQPAIVVGGGWGGGGGGGMVSRDGMGGHRGSPQEHSDLTPRPHNPTDLELNQQIHFVNEPSPMGTGGGGADDCKCPVCGQDFSHITMDEFQTHVFECFDDVEDTSNAPETLQPQQGQRAPQSHERVCPMCQKSFAERISQDFFESHVQSHFEDVVDHFEVLDVHRT